jgi:hypothetical protein
VSSIGAIFGGGREAELRDSLWVKCLHWGHLSSLPLSEIVTTRAWYYYPKNRFCQKKNLAKVETRNPPLERVSEWAPTGWMSQWCNRPPMRERSSRKAPSLAAGSSLWGTKRRRGVGRWWCFTPLFANGVGIQVRESRPSSPASASSLAFAGVPIRAALATIRITRP